MVRMVTGLFETRRAAEIAVERMVQDRGFDRTRIQAFAEGAENSSGTVVSGADADDQRRGEPVEGRRAGAIRVLAQVGEDVVEDGAGCVSGRRAAEWQAQTISR
jgi:hypothetical protein